MTKSKNLKRQNTNVTKYKKTIHKYDKIQKDKNKCDNIQKEIVRKKTSK